MPLQSAVTKWVVWWLFSPQVLPLQSVWFANRLCYVLLEDLVLAVSIVGIVIVDACSLAQALL